jgi:hypothetical protein
VQTQAGIQLWPSNVVPSARPPRTRRYRLASREAEAEAGLLVDNGAPGLPLRAPVTNGRLKI